MHAAPVIVTGTHHSEMTWTGNMLGLAQTAARIRQPLSLEQLPVQYGRFAYRMPFWYTYVGEENGQEHEAAFRALFHFRYHIDSAVRRLETLGEGYSEQELKVIDEYARFASAAAAGKVPLVEDPFMLLCVRWLQKTFDARTVIVMRHPASFVASLLETGLSFGMSDFLAQPLLMKDYPVEDERDIELHERFTWQGNASGLMALGWKYLNSVIRRSADVPGVKLVRQEDLSSDPVAQFRDLYRHTGLPFGPAVEKGIRESREKRRRGRGAPAGDEVPNWSRRLDPAQLDAIREIVEPESRHFYGDRDWRVDGVRRQRNEGQRGERIPLTRQTLR